MKFGQLIVYNIRNIMENHAQNVVERLFIDPFLKNQVKLKKRGDLELISQLHFVHDFRGKIFLRVHFIN